jgi:regulatory protein
VSAPRRPHDRPPLGAEALERLALAYAGRYATSRAGLARYLLRKIRERGWGEEEPPQPEDIAERFATLGYVDDKGLAEARGRSLARRGLGARRLAGALGALGIAAPDAAEALTIADAAAWDTALRYAERRRIGPFARAVPDEAGRRRFFAAMIRAGHSSQLARKIIAALPGVVPLRDE